MITPKSPKALPKISTTRILTNSVEFCASDSAALLPTTPTEILQNKKLYDSAQCQARQSVHNQDKLTHKMAHVNNLRDPAACATTLPASQVGPACCQPRAQDGVSSCICRCGPQTVGKLIDTLNLCLENDCHNDPVNGHCFAKNDTASTTHKSLMDLHDAQCTRLDNAVYLIRFFDVMRGTRMAAPSRLLPVMNMPL